MKRNLRRLSKLLYGSLTDRELIYQYFSFLAEGDEAEAEEVLSHLSLQGSRLLETLRYLGEAASGWIITGLLLCETIEQTYQAAMEAAGKLLPPRKQKKFLFELELEVDRLKHTYHHRVMLFLLPWIEKAERHGFSLPFLVRAFGGPGWGTVLAQRLEELLLLTHYEALKDRYHKAAEEFFGQAREAPPGQLPEWVSPQELEYHRILSLTEDEEEGQKQENSHD